LREIDLSGSLLPRHHGVLRALGAISTRLGTDSWCLVGGMMVLIASRFTGQSADRAEQTKDADVLVDICTRPDILAKVVNELQAFGFTQMEPFGENAARCTFQNFTGHGQIDVLCPDDASDAALDTVPGTRSLAIPGGRRALELSGAVNITYSQDNPDVVLRVPLLPGAIVVKSAAALDERTADQERHIQDVVDMLSILEDPGAARSLLHNADREILSALRTRLDDDGDVAWERMGDPARLRERAAFELLSARVV
jgi:hypothetical protein